LQVFIEELCEFAQGVFGCLAVVGRSLIAEKTVVGVRVNLQCVILAEFLNLIVTSHKLSAPGRPPQIYQH
jgi:hypothetical protein